MKIKLQKFIYTCAFIMICLCLCILGYMTSLQWPYVKEVTPYQLSETTQSLLKSIHQPVDVTLYTNDIDTHHLIKMLIERYQRIQPSIHFQWAKKNIEGAYPHHALIIRFGNSQHIIDIDKQKMDENQLTNALFILCRKPNQWVVFLKGHDEPSPFNTQNSDFNLFRIGLENQGLKVQELNLSQTPFIPDNTGVLIIASPKSALLPKEEALITNYIAKGKDLLWLIDPSSAGIPSLSKILGVYTLPGTIVDLQGQKLGTPHPAITIITQYPNIPFGAPKTLTAFPFAQALQKNDSDFQSQPLLMTHPDTWTEIGSLSNQIAFDPEKNEHAGPLLLGISLNRKLPFQEHTQRIVVIGNSRFISNGAIENYGNLAFALNLLNWLNHDDMLLQISQPIVNDSLPQIHLMTALLIQYGYPLLSCLLFIFSMLLFYLRKRRSNKIASRLALR